MERDNEKEKSKAVKTSARRAAKVPYVDQLKLHVRTLGKQVNLEGNIGISAHCLPTFFEEVAGRCEKCALFVIKFKV